MELYDKYTHPNPLASKRILWKRKNSRVNSRILLLSKYFPIQSHIRKRQSRI